MTLFNLPALASGLLLLMRGIAGVIACSWLVAYRAVRKGARSGKTPADRTRKGAPDRAAPASNWTTHGRVFHENEIASFLHGRAYTDGEIASYLYGGVYDENIAHWVPESVPPKPKALQLQCGISVRVTDSIPPRVALGTVELPLEEFLQVAEHVMTSRDLVGSQSDGIDPRYRFKSLVSSLMQIEGRGTGATRFAVDWAGSTGRRRGGSRSRRR